MPKTKFQDFIFTIIMVVVMVYAMVCYNIAFDKGAMSGSVFLIAFWICRLWALSDFCLSSCLSESSRKKSYLSILTLKTQNLLLSLL